MIVDFTVKNYLSIKDEISLSFLSNNKNISPELKTIPIENGKFKLYSFSAIYGPNASGKSNIIKALSDFFSFVKYSHKFDLDEDIPSYKPFKLDQNFRNAPTTFEIELVCENIRYEYHITFTGTIILKEVLNFYPEGKIALLFHREFEKPIKFGNYFTGEKKRIETFLLPNRLFLSVAANSKSDILKPLFRYFRDKVKIHVRMDSAHAPFHSTTLALRDKEGYKSTLQKMLKAADLSITDVKLVEDENLNDRLEIPSNVPDDVRKRILDDFRYRPYLGHKIFNNLQPTNQIEYFNLEEEESTGTIKLYDIAGEVLDSLKNGSVLVIDEFNSGLHPLLNRMLVTLFIDQVINKGNAQLLISTHDTCVLDLEVLKREQIWFTDRNKYGATELFSLDEFDKNLIRENMKYGKHYLNGRFQAVPSVDYRILMEDLLNA